MAHCGIYQIPHHFASCPFAAYLFTCKGLCSCISVSNQNYEKETLFPTLLPLSIINSPLCGAILGITRIALCGSRGVLGAVKKACCSSALLILFLPLACCAYIQTSSSSAAAGRRASHTRARRLDEPFQEQS